METIKRNIPYVLFISLSLKLLILGSSNLFDILALFVIGLGLAFFEIRLENAKFQELSNKIDNLDKKHQENSQILENTRNSITALKAAQGLKPLNMNKF